MAATRNFLRNEKISFIAKVIEYVDCAQLFWSSCYTYNKNKITSLRGVAFKNYVLKDPSDAKINNYASSNHTSEANLIAAL